MPQGGCRVDLVVKVSGVSNERNVLQLLHLFQSDDVQLHVEETKISYSETAVSMDTTCNLETIRARLHFGNEHTSTRTNGEQNCDGTT